MAQSKRAKRKNALLDEEVYTYKPTKKDKIRAILRKRLKIEAKTENQRLFIDAIKDPSVEFVIGSGISGCGKAQPLTAPILTPNGWNLMGDIKVGDFVIAGDGTPTEVIGVFPQGEKDIYTVAFDDGTSTECCGEHLWLTQTYLDRRFLDKKTGIRSQRSGTVKSTKEIAETLIYCNHTNHTIPTVLPVQFTTKDFLIDPYVLGALLGDGGLTQKVTFSTADVESINELGKILGDDYVIKHYAKYSFNIKAAKGKKNGLLFALRKMGLIGTKSETKFIPSEYLLGDVNQRLSLLQGLLDTDGSISKNGMKIEFSSASQMLANGLVELVQSLGGIARKTSKKTFYTKEGERIHCQLSYRVSISMNPLLVPFRLSRKVERYVPRTTYAPKRFIKSVELVGRELAQCIMVAHESHLYLTNDYIVTHNTFLALVEALNLLQDDKNHYDEIMIFKSITPLKGEDIGALPGNVDEKLLFIYQSFFMQLEKLIPADELKKLYDEKIIKIMPLGTIRGISIPATTIVIVDEVQNLTSEKVHTAKSRMSEGAKMILIGDEKQCDTKVWEDNGLTYLVQCYTNVHPSIEVISFNEDDSVRSPLIKMFQQTFDKYSANLAKIDKESRRK